MRSLLEGFATAVTSRRPHNRAPGPYVGPGTGIWGLFDGTDRGAALASMTSTGTVFAIVDRLATSVAELQWGLWRTAASGKKADRKPVTRHAALDRLTQPNPFTRRRAFMEAGQQHYELVGEAYWVVYQLTPHLPLELWTVRPDRMTPVPHPEKFLTGWIYTGPAGEKVPLTLDQVIQIKRPSPLDPYRGVGPVQSILADIDSARYGAEWNRNFFLNGAEPGGIVELPEALGDDEFQQMVTRWREQHQGVHNAHRVAVLERGKWVERKFSMRDMQFTELRRVSRDTIREAWGFPKMMTGDVEDVNRANALAGERLYARWLVQTRGEMWKDVLNFDLLPKFGPTARGLEFDYVSPIPEDREDTDRERDSKTQAWATLVDAGADPDDASDAVGLPRMRVTRRQPEPQPEPIGV
jgi:HK97 family phage portal protein